MKFKFYLFLILFWIINSNIYSQTQFFFNIDENKLNLKINTFQSHCYAKYAVDFFIQNNVINIYLKDTSNQKCKVNCTIDMDLNIINIPNGNYSLNLYNLESNNNFFQKETNKIIYKREFKINGKNSKSALSYDFKHSTCLQQEHYQPQKGIEIYPNPAFSKISLKVDLTNNSDVNFKILNFLGKEIASFDKKNLSGGSHILQFDGLNIQPGVYIGKLTTSNGQVYSIKIYWSK